MDDEILHREFWIDASRSYLLSLTNEMVHDPRVRDFDKIAEDDICKTDAVTLCRWLDWMEDFIKAKADKTDLKAQNYRSAMGRMKSKLQRKIEKAG